MRAVGRYPGRYLRRSIRWSMGFCALIGVALLSGTALGQELDFAPPSLLDQWDEASPRFNLSSCGVEGIECEPVSRGELMSNTRGGKSISGATRYGALLDVPVLIDLDAVECPLPGRIFALGQNTHGEGLSRRFVGDKLVVSNINSLKNITQVGELWWEFPLLHEDLVVRVGKQDINTEFLVMEVADDFVQSSFGLSPSDGLPSYPAQGMGAIVLAQAAEELQIRFGFSDNDISLVILEAELATSSSDSQLPGTIEFGAAYGERLVPVMTGCSSLVRFAPLTLLAPVSRPSKVTLSAHLDELTTDVARLATAIVNPKPVGIATEPSTTGIAFEVATHQLAGLLDTVP